MADTMKFGPEWLRALSGDASAPTGPAPAPSSKFKLSEYRYGREEMLALFQPPYTPAAHLLQFPHIIVEETQTPICLLPLSEDEERLMAQGVNSNLMRTGRGGGLPIRGGRGGAVDRGRGRGRGRGESYSVRGPVLENGDVGGGFGRPRGPNKDGWEEVGGRKLDRGFARPFEEPAVSGPARYNRSMSSENWRDKGPVDEDEDADWRKTGANPRERWSTRTSWREAGRGGTELERNGSYTRTRGFEIDHRGQRIYTGDVPEWAEDGADDVGTFDSSGAFVSNKERPYQHYHHEHRAEADQQRGSGDQLQDREREPAHREGRGEGGRGEAPDEAQPQPPPSPQQQQQQQQQQRRPPPSPQNTRSPPRLSNGRGGSSPASSEAQAPPPSPLPPRKESGSGVSAQVASLVAAAVSAAPMLPSMPQGVTLTNILIDEKTEAKDAVSTSLTDENAMKWLYTDPQGEVQGPFLAEEMAQWFSAGYFTMNLLVKRGCDQQFQPLGELMKRLGHVPFLPGPATAPPIMRPAPTSAPPSTVEAVVSTVAPVSAPSSAPPPPLPSFPLGPGAATGADGILMQQQLLLQHQILQVQMGMRQLQMQTLAQLQDQDSFKALEPAQQQQLSMQMMQSNPLVLNHMQQLQQLQHLQQQTTQQQQQQQQQISSQSQGQTPAPPPIQQQSQPPSGVDVSQSPPNFQRSVSQPAPSAEGQGDIPSIWGTAPPAAGWTGSQPGSVWELEAAGVPQAIKSTDLDKLRQEKEAEFARLMEEERSRQEEIQRQQEELRRQTEALQRQRERMEREKDQLETQRKHEMQRVEEIRRLKEDERKRAEEAARQEQQEETGRRKRAEEQRRKEEEQRAREEEEARRKEEERKRQHEEDEIRKQQEFRRKREAEEKALQEMKREEERRQQLEAEKQKTRDMEKQQETTEAAQRKQQEFQRQQQEALKRLQQQQAMQNIQLPSSANWARQQQQQAGQSSGQSRSLADIQQEEEIRQLQQNQERQELMRIQAETLAQQQRELQNSQKSWASNLAKQQPSRGKSLAEIQEEQERQLRQERHKVQQTQQQQAKTMSLSQAAVWGAGPPLAPPAPTPWAAGSVWGSDASLGLWDSNPAPTPTHSAATKKAGSHQPSAEFPALRTQKSNKSKPSAPKSTPAPAPAKPKKEEEAVQRLFKPMTQSKDEFTVWCEKFLSTMDVQIDIETFVSFLQAVDSPYEVHDYVKNYLGEGKNAREFAKQFLEKRSHYKNKARNEKRHEEESIWGPAPALNPHEGRGGGSSTAPLNDGFTEVVGSKAKAGKKKKKMQKMDCLLGFTVEKDPNRKNAGQIENLE